MDFISINVMLGFLATLSMAIGLMNNAFIYFYLRQKLPVKQTAFDQVVADNLIVISFNTFLTYVIYTIGLTNLNLPNELCMLLTGLNQILYMAYNASALVIITVKYLYLEYARIMFETSDATIRKVSWIAVGFLTLIYTLLNNYGPKQSLLLFKFLVKDENIERFYFT